ncbi:MAG TPA: ferritin-like domain-containing protein [Mariprofundaceae bacterium]|nr:ferritin-like domain-containing protein [Mariprofundaceae bacterium]
MNEVRRAARACLLLGKVDEKLQAVRQLYANWQQGNGAFDVDSILAPVEYPGLPDRPELVQGAKVPRRGFATVQGRRVMMHAIAHIEFNAINLALDAMCRFAGMPEEYYADWLQVAAEDAYHFELIRAHLRYLGADYGDFTAHAGLWDMCEKTAADVLDRMALVPRVLEARGLDVTPGIQAKLAHAGDANAAGILDIILRDEVGHVAIGSRWFRYVCEQRGLNPTRTFFALLDKHYPKGLFGPYNLGARRQAGFSESEIEMLTRCGK